MDDSRGGQHHSYNGTSSNSQSHGGDRYPSHSSSSQQQQQHYQHQQQQHPPASYPRESRSHSQQQFPRDPDVGAAWRSPITPTTTHRFNKMAIHEVLDSHQHQQQQHPYGYEEDSPPYKRKGSPEEFSFSDPPASSSSVSHSGPGSHHHLRHYGRGEIRQQQDYHRPPSPRYRHESPLPGSNSEDEDDDIRNYKKRRMFPGMKGGPPQQSPPNSSPGGQPEVMDQVRSTLKLKQQQKAIIESRQQGQPSPLPQPSTSRPNSSSNGNPPVTETSSSGLSVFHGSSSFASLNRGPQPSPKNPKNAKSLTIFAPSYSDSTLSIHSAPLQPSQSHQAMGMGLRTSQPLRNQTHPYAHQAGSFHQPLRSPRAAGHAKKSSRTTLRQPGAGTDSSSGTIPAPILSSHTGPLPSPSMYPSTPFLSNPKHIFMETVSNLFDSVDTSRGLKYTLEEQVRKSAQLLQTLQASGTMIENLVRGQFKELEKGVIERFEGELEHLNARVRQLEEHQGLAPPPKKLKAIPASSAPPTSTPPSSSSAMTGVTSSLSGASEPAAGAGAAEGTHEGPTSGIPVRHSSSSPNSGTLPTPPLTKNHDSSSAMEVEDGEEREPSEQGSSSIKGLQERIANLEGRKD